MIVFIDGENYRQNLAKILAENKNIIDKDAVFKYNTSSLLKDVLSQEDLDIRYYSSEIKTPKGYIPTKNIQKHLAMIKEKMRKWVAYLKTQDITYIKAGNLKVKEGKECYNCKAKSEILQEKGVDVRLALDIFETSLSDTNEIAVFSSDTDLCPALHKAKAHGTKIKYICFATRVNRAISAVCDETITITSQKLEEYLAEDAPKESPEKLDDPNQGSVSQF